MSHTYIRKELREHVHAQAKGRCGYCQTSETVVGIAMEIDHIIPEAFDGPTVEDNLWLACPTCNETKGGRISAVDPDTGLIVRLFDPRHQRWRDHFIWEDAGEIIAGITPEGRATVQALDLNRSVQVVARRGWIVVGWHPPHDEETV